MASEADIRHLSEYELDEAIDSYEEDQTDDNVGFTLFYDGSIVDPWDDGPNELVRLYFNDDRLDEYYVPITYAEQIEDGMRSTPIGDPIGDGESFEETNATVDLEQGATIDGAEFDLLWYEGSDETEDEQVIAAADFGRAED